MGPLNVRRDTACISDPILLFTEHFILLVPSPKLIDVIPVTPAPVLQMRRWMDSEHLTQNLKEKALDVG